MWWQGHVRPDEIGAGVVGEIDAVVQFVGERVADVERMLGQQVFVSARNL